MSTRPFSPQDVIQNQITSIPDEMIEAVNELLLMNINDRTAIITQDDIINLFLTKKQDTTVTDIFTNRWLDIELMYHNAGWRVIYNPVEEPSFIFRSDIITRKILSEE